MKQIKLKDQTHKELLILKTKGGHKTMDDTIAELLKERRRKA